MEELKQKLQSVIEKEVEYVEKTGSSMLSTCDHYNWDQDIYRHRHSIIKALENRGYSVSVMVRHGVIDITTTKQITLT